jgi:hypothetical protein
MERTEIAKLLEDTYSVANQPFVTRVICKDEITFYGCFNSFEDSAGLKEKNQYRFVPRNNSIAFKNEFSKNGKYNTRHSIIVEGEDVVSIEFVLPLHI